MKKLLLPLLIVLSVLPGCNNDNDENLKDQIQVPEGYTLIWNDEFDGANINSANWNYETGDGTDYGLPVGWGNDEKQIYTNSSDNSGIETDEEHSVLAITSREESSGRYTSAKLTTKDLFSMRFGRVEVRAKLPEGQGIWPAIWMLGDNNDVIEWPGCGEIDIVEVLGHQPDVMHSTLHYTNDENKHGEIQNTYELATGTFSDDYHIFSLDWSPESLTFGLNGTDRQTMPIADDMKEFLRSFYLIMNVAVGGNWPGDPDETTVFPQTMYVDYVRVYSKNDMEVPEAPELNVEEESIGQVIEPTIARNAFKETFTDLGNMEVLAWGGGGEPEISESATAIDGDMSLSFNFPGGNWGGAYIRLQTPKDLSSYTHLVFSLNHPPSLVNAEIKLESPASNAAIFLVDYTGTDVSGGFTEYSIPFEDFAGLNLSEVIIPFSIWNPQDANENFVAGTVLIDNVYFSN